MLIINFYRLQLNDGYYEIGALYLFCCAYAKDRLTLGSALDINKEKKWAWATGTMRTLKHTPLYTHERRQFVVSFGFWVMLLA